MANRSDYDFYDYEPDGDEDYDDEDEFLECHMDRTGACGKAGSEECDFECPYRAEQIVRERTRQAQHPNER